MKKIIISVTNDIITDQRVFRIANSLSNNGFEVFIIGRKTRNSLPIENFPFKFIRFRLIFGRGPFFYACFNLRLFLYLLINKTDMLLSNDLDTLLPNYIISRLKRIPLVYDSHEYFTEVPELVNRQGTKKIWLLIENYILPKLNYACTVSQSIADAYFEKYNIDMKVIRNLPVLAEPTKKKIIISGLNGEKVILYQGTLNPGRGIETAIEAMRYIPDAKFVIVGEGPERNKLEKLSYKLKLTDKVLFMGRYLPSDLKSITSQADVGISLEENIGLSYKYSLPNKLFDYIHANVPVLVSPLIEMKGIVEEYGIGEVLEKHSPEYLAEKIKDMLADKEKILEWKKNLLMASRDLCWENEEQVLFKLFKQIKKIKK